MSKFAKGKSWIEHRLADELTLQDTLYRVDLVARKGTGVQGFRVTVVFLPLEGGPDAEIDLPNAASTAEIHGLVRELASRDDRLQQLFTEARSK